MCTSQVRQFIEQVVADKVGSNTMFTLFDVTLEVKELEKASNLPVSRHSEIHDDVRDVANKTGWNRLLRPMGGGLTANVYFNPTSHDPNAYTPLPRKDASGINPAAVAFANNDDDDDNDDDYKQLANPSDGGKAPDRWGRLRIEASIIHQVGFKPGEMVFAKVTPNGLSLDKTAPGVAHYVVDCHANVRITPRTLKAANLLGKVSYRIYPSKDIVEIS